MRGSPDFAERIGTRIRLIRLAQGMSQAEVAARAKTGRPYICQIELGKFDIRLDTIFDLCRALRVQPSQLFEGITVEWEDLG